MWTRGFLISRALLMVALTLACREGMALETKIDGFDATERPQFVFTSEPRRTAVPGVFEIHNSIRTPLKESSVKGLRIHSIDAEWISGALRGPLCPEAEKQVAKQQPPQQPTPAARPCNPLERRVRAVLSFFSVDPSDFGVGYGFKLEAVLFEGQAIKSLPPLSGGAPAYMPIHRITGVIPSGLMPQFFSNPRHAPAQKLEIIAQLSVGGFKTPTITGDMVKDNAVFQTRSVVTRSSKGLYTYEYGIDADYKRGVAFNWTSVRTPQYPSGWKGRLPKFALPPHELKDRSEPPLLVNDPAFVSFGSAPRYVEEISALSLSNFPIPPALNKDVPLSTVGFQKASDNATGDMKLGETTVSAILQYLQSVKRELVEYMFLAPALIPDTLGITPR